MPRLRSLIAIGLLLLAASCRRGVDIAAAAKDLLDTDRAWARLAGATANVDSVVAYWTADARVILPGTPVLVGTDALRQMVAGTRTILGFHITWVPDSAVVDASGDFGYTYGRNQVTAPDSTGRPKTIEGRYITVWRKDPGGRWRCAVDIYNEGPTGSTAAR